MTPVAQAAFRAHARTFGGDGDWPSLPDHRKVRWGMVAVELNANRQETPNDVARAFYIAYHFDQLDFVPPWTEVNDQTYVLWARCAAELRRIEREDQ